MRRYTGKKERFPSVMLLIPYKKKGPCHLRQVPFKMVLLFIYRNELRGNN